MLIDASQPDYREVNTLLRSSSDNIELTGCCGQRFIAAGYAMRGGKIYVQGDAGYRVGIHMKEYKEKRPVIVIGGICGSILYLLRL